LKGLLAVFKDDKHDYFVQTECAGELENSGELQLIYEDGKFYNQTTLEEIRNKLNKI